MRSNHNNASNVSLARRQNADSRDLLSPFGSADAGLFDDLSSFMSASPFQLLGRMQQDMDRLFSQVMGVPPVSAQRQGGSLLPTTTLFSPTVDVSETEREYRIEVDLPGFPEDAVDVRVIEGTLIVRAETQQDWKNDSGSLDSSVENGQNRPQSASRQPRQYHHRERRWGRFERVFTLPPNADDDNIHADFQSGVLTLTIPKKTLQPAGANGRRITIGASSDAAQIEDKQADDSAKSEGMESHASATS
ncbi:MAG: Hsp20/alpha crystallin family protein [Armatimonadota bacterium]